MSRGPCPVCNRGRRDTALSVTTDERGTVEYCHRCGYTASENHERRSDTSVSSASTSSPPRDWSTKAEQIWCRTRPLRGSLGETYLRGRGCLVPSADGDLRYLPADERHPPTLCARITDTITARPISLHFTRLAADGRGKAGTDHDKLLLAGHRKRGGVIRLWPDDVVTHSLGVAEGIESALGAAHYHTPVWSAIDASNLSTLSVLAGIECLVVFADHDEAGIQAAQQCAYRWRTAGREVHVWRSKTRGEDAADVARRVDR
jgi:hypothetical protein